MNLAPASSAPASRPDAIRVDLFNDPAEKPFATNIDLREAFPEDDDFNDAAAQLAADGSFWSGGGAGPAIFVKRSTAPAPRIPSWINRPYGVIDVTATLTFPDGGAIGDFEARVTVYFDEDGDWQVGEMEVQQLRDDVTSYVLVEQDAGAERTLSGFLVDAILAEAKRDWFDKAVADLSERMAADARDAA